MDLDDSGILGAETIYGTHEENHVVMSEKVQSLAGSIYQEFERMIAQYDEDVVKTLMPLLVNVLECLDAAYQTNREHDVDLELLREDNEQLVTQYEREKGARKAAEQKLLEFEDAADGEKKEMTTKIEALESIARMLELKHKNSMEHNGRLEEREGELKKEYSKLHERYTDLFKTHVDYMERTKILLSGGQLANELNDSGRLNANRLSLGRSSGPISFGFASLEVAEGVDSVPTSPISSCHSSPSLHSELETNVKDAVQTMEKSQETDSINLENKSVVTSPISPQAPVAPSTPAGRVQTKKEQRSANTLYQELSFQDSDALADIDDGADITGGWVHPGEYASSVNDNFYGMGKEVENLIMENNELLATKNALNVVKDDLIVKVDELTGEQEMLREEILTLNLSKTKLQKRVTELEDELKKVKENADAKPDSNEEETDVPMAQRKRFTRVEMARVLMERNQYKERFMELQEAVRWTEMLRVTRSETALTKNKKSVWKFFSNLFSSEQQNQGLGGPHITYNASNSQVVPGVKALPRPTPDYLETEMGMKKVNTRRALERREQYQHVRAHVRKKDGCVQAYGWSLPGKDGSSSKSSSSGVPVPVIVYCRPLVESSKDMSIWCAAGANLQGGYTKDGGLMVGGSVFYSEDNSAVLPVASNEVETLDKELNANKEAALLETQLSSLVWICTSMHSASVVTIIDANNPAEILNSFGVCASHVLCIASVPGASPSDYNIVTKVVETSEEDESNDNDAMEAKPEDDKTDNSKAKSKPKPNVGKVTYVENAQVCNRRDKYKRKTEADVEKSTESSKESDGSTNESAETKESSAEDDNSNEESTAHEVMSSVLATMWFGAQNGMIYVHSAVTSWNQCLHSVQLADCVIGITHVNGCVVAGLANGTVVVFRRDSEGEWDLSRYHIVKIGFPINSVIKVTVVGDKVWCGIKNMIHVLDPIELKIVHSFEAHPRSESQVRELAWLGDGVWMSIRLDSTLRLYHAYTYQHLQDVDIEPYVSKMLGTGKIGFSLVRITTLLISCNRLWIGTSNGVIISVPLNECCATVGAIVPRAGMGPGGIIRVISPPRNTIPYCNMAHAQLSFHGHQDVVKFFVSVPGTGGMSAASTPSEAHSTSTSPTSGPIKPPKAMLVISGGEGYIDFRVGDGEMEESTTEINSGDQPNAEEKKELKSHLIVWQVSQP